MEHLHQIKHAKDVVKLIVLFSLLSHTGAIHAQKKLDEAYLKCTYDYVYLKDTLNNVQSIKDIIHLQVGKEVSKCYSYLTFYSDSISALPNALEVKRQLMRGAVSGGKVDINKAPVRHWGTFVYKNYPEGKVTVTDNISLSYYQYEDELNAQDWQILDSIKTVLDYPCQLAICDFRGRQWSVWFASDIPINNGPWLLGGLPGMILEAYDRGYQYHFLITGLQQIENEPIVFSLPTVDKVKVHEKTTRKEFLKTRDYHLHNTSAFIKMETGIDLGGNEPPKKIPYNLIERDYQ